jgi:hypothetical protein
LLPELDAVLGQPQLIGQAPPAKEVATTAMPKSEAPGILVVLVKRDRALEHSGAIKEEPQCAGYGPLMHPNCIYFFKHFAHSFAPESHQI